MRSEALYQKYRSQSFDEVVGQEYVVRSIRNAIREGKVGHAYLFCGPRGTGKTTMARLLARAVNCENPAEAPCGHCENCQAAISGSHPDIIEINAANETHVEDIRDLIERARLAPMMGRHKIYIIDEVHQLSSSAASALLKTLEEPPEHIIFILATTDPQKLLNTIISRCQRFDFSKVSVPQIRDHLLHIAEEEHMTMEPAAAEKLALLADGGMRDALSMLEQASAYTGGNITEDAINEIYGLASTAEKLGLLETVFDGDLATLLERVEGYENSGLDLKRLTADLINALKDGVIYAYTKNENLLRTITGEQANMLACRCTPRRMLDMTDALMKASEAYKTAQSVSSVFEVTCLRLVADQTMPVEEPVPVQAKPKPVRHAEPVQISTPVPEPQPEPEPVETVTQQESEPAEPAPQPVIEAAPERIPEPAPKHAGMEMPDAVGVVSLLVQCDKDSKAEDSAKFDRIVSGLAMDRYAAALKQTELKASGKDCLVLTASSRVVAATINEPEMNEAMYFYLRDHAGMDKVVFAVTDTVYQEAVQKFIEMRKSGTLPEAMAVTRYTEKKEEKGEAPGPEDRLRSLLDDDDLLQVYE